MMMMLITVVVVMVMKAITNTVVMMLMVMIPNGDYVNYYSSQGQNFKDVPHAEKYVNVKI